MPDNKQPTLTDVATHAGVSTATVSRCLNAPDKVREGVRQLVLAAVSELGYVPSGAARALASKRTRTIGAVIPTLDSAIFARGIQSLQKSLSQSGYRLLLASSDYIVKQEAEEVRALVLGTVAVMILYVLANGAFLHVLGFEGLRASDAVATDVVNRVIPSGGGGLISALICISALGAVNGLVFTGARISYAIGADHRMFKPLGKWDERRGTPANALLIQGVIAVTLIIALGSFIDAILYTAAVVYSFYLASTAGIIVLRLRDQSSERPFRVPGYPITPLLFGAVCLFLIHSAVTYKPVVAGVACVLLLLGLPLYWVSCRKPEQGSE